MKQNAKRTVRTAAAAIMGLCLTASADVVSLVTNDGTTETLTKAANWSPAVSPTDAASAGDDYVAAISGLRTPAATFLCHSLTIGSSTVRADVYEKAGTMSFSDAGDGLIIVNTIWADWAHGGGPFLVNGPVVFSDVKTVACTFQGMANDANYIVREFTGRVSSSASGRFDILKKTVNAETDWYGIRFSGDLSQYFGTMRLSQYARLEIGSTTMPGRIWTGTGTTTVAHTAGSSGFCVGTVDWADGTALEVALDRDAGASQTLTVTKAATFGGKVRIRVASEKYTTGSVVPERTYPVLIVPEGVTLTEDVFELVSDAVDVSKLSIALSPAVGGGTVLSLVHAAAAQIVNHVHDNRPSNSTAAWDDGKLPHGNAEYVCGSGHYLYMYETVFPGLSLTLGGSTMIDRANDITISNLIVTASSTIGNWDAASKTSASLSANGIRHHRGDIRLDAKLNVYSIVPLHFVFDGNLTGDNEFYVYQNGTMASRFYCELCGVNTFGKLTAAAHSSATSFENGFALCFHSGDNLGGNPAAFKDDMNVLPAFVAYLPRESTTLETMNRGIKAAGGAFETPEGVTLTVKQKITYTAALHKRGAGTFSLAGEYAASGVTPTVNVEDGWLRSDTKTAAEGLALVFSGDAGIEARFADEGPAAVSDCGLCNATGAVAVNTDDGKLHVRLVAARPARRGTVPVLTVSSATAAQLRGKLVFDKPAPRYRGVLREVPNQDGSVTFVADVFETGLALIVR